MRTCKHIYGVQSIVKEFFEEPKDNELVGDILHMESNLGNIEILSLSQVEEPVEEAISNDAIGEKMLNSMSELN